MKILNRFKKTSNERPLWYKNIKHYGLLNNYDNLRQIATVLGMNYPTFFNKVTGRRPWLLEEAYKLSKLLSVSIEDLFYKEITK